MSIETPSRPSGRGGSFVGIVIALIIGIAAGVVFQQPLRSIFHGHDHAAADTTKPGAAKQLWTCSMHPQVIKEEPGLCPICHMALTPVKSAAAGGAGVTIDPVVVQNMGIRVAKVTTGPVRREVRAVGYLDEAQPNVRDVNLRVSGWVEKLHADTVGMALSKGAPLFELYSPEVQVGLEELIAARRSLGTAGPDSIGGKTTQTLFDAARLKLEQWGLDTKQVEELAKLDRPPRTVTFISPIDGYLTQKMLVQGGAVKSGDTMLKIVDLSTVWLDSQVYAQDLPFVRLGGTVTATVEGAPGKRFEGQVIFVQPELDPQTRTAIVRIELPNMELNLRPGMYATAGIRATLVDQATLVPREAVIDTGTRQVVFVVTGAGRFDPRPVRLGADAEGGMAQVIEGLSPGETVVTSGQFLLDAESRMREAIQKHMDGQLLASAGGSPTPMPPATMPAAVASVATAPPATMPTVPASAVDRIVQEYLKLQNTLGVAQQADTPLELKPIIDAAHAAHTGPAADMVMRIVDAATAMQGKPLADQRKGYKPLSDAVIALARANPPSAAVAEKLYVAFCPMAPGDGARWLQTSTTITNPYFATRMKECGSIEQTIASRKAE